MTNFPKKGKKKDHLLDEMKKLRQNDVKWEEGKVFSLVYHAGDEAAELAKEAYTMFFSENGLNPTAFPSLRKFETDVVKMAIDLLGGDSYAVGNMTSGGTESILMAVKTARDLARDKFPEITHPEMILPISAHPAFEKAADYFDVRSIRVPVDGNYVAEPLAFRDAISPNTILLVGSAPSYPHGVVDPIRDIASLAIEKGILCHVDSCVGGFMLPFVRELGYSVPDFDFKVPGVTSMSADLHKYAYAAKPASLILYRNKELRRYQMHAYTEWPGGIYASPTMTGSRPGGAIAAAWAVLNYFGMEGYLDIASIVMKASKEYISGIDEIEGLNILGNPSMSIFAIHSDKYNIFEIGDELSEKGWHLDRQQFPNSLHMTVNFSQTGCVDEFLADLKSAVKQTSNPSIKKWFSEFILKFIIKLTNFIPKPILSKIVDIASPLIQNAEPTPSSRSAAMYGMMGNLPNRGDIKEIVLDLVEKFTEPQT